MDRMCQNGGLTASYRVEKKPRQLLPQQHTYIIALGIGGNDIGFAVVIQIREQPGKSMADNGARESAYCWLGQFQAIRLLLSIPRLELLPAFSRTQNNVLDQECPRYNPHHPRYETD